MAFKTTILTGSAEKSKESGIRQQALGAAEGSALGAVPERIRPLAAAYLKGGVNGLGPVEELRFRVGQPVQIRTANGELLLRDQPPFTENEAKTMLETICDHSVYAREQELTSGFVTMPGGVRVGLSGAPIFEDGRIVRLTSVSGFNIRIPRQVIGCAEPFIRRLTEGGRVRSAVIASPPRVGKTTFLRDCIRCFSDGIGVRAQTVAVADERNELTGSVNGAACLNVGARTDAMIGVPKSVSIPLLVRSMAPDVIVTDELFGEADISAVAEAAKYGVAVLASVHAASASELAAKRWLVDALLGGVLARVFILKRSVNMFDLRSVDLKNGRIAEDGCGSFSRIHAFEAGAERCKG